MQKVPVHTTDVAPGAVPGTALASPLPDADVYPFLHDLEKQKAVYKAFMHDEMDLVTAAFSASVPVNTALRWAYNGRWVDKREELVKTLAREEGQKIELMRIGKRHEELEAQIATGKALRDRVDKELEAREWSPAQLKMLADTAKAASDISVRAVGVGDSGLTSREFANKEAEEKKVAGKMPLVVLIQGGGLPHVRPATVDYENAQPL